MKRVQLITVYKNSVIANGFGDLLKEYKVGEVVNNNSRAVTVKFNDKDGNYLEIYTIGKGIRVDDLGESTGWKINTLDWTIKEGKDFLPTKCNEKKAKGVSRFEKLHKEQYTLDKIDGNTHELIIEVWQDMEIGGKYIRVYREITIEGKFRKKQTPALLPLSVLTKVMGKLNI